jgi:hypothetical protein
LVFALQLAPAKSIPGLKNCIREIFSLAAQTSQPNPSQLSEPQLERAPPQRSTVPGCVLGPESGTLSLSSIPKGYQGGPGAMWQGEDLSVDPHADASFETTQPVNVDGSRAIDLARSYEAGIRDMYGPTVSSARQYTALVNGQEVNGVADNVVSINGQSIAIEAKFVDDWSVSLRNPDSINGSEPWAVAEQQNMLDQVAKYSAAFDQVIYHTNSVDLADLLPEGF